RGHRVMEMAGRRILVVDDDPIVADSLSDFLRAEGCETRAAYDWPEALRALEEAERQARGADSPPRPFDVVICDVSLPSGSGLDLLRTIGEKHPTVVVIMLTGYGTIEAAVEALRRG